MKAIYIKYLSATDTKGTRYKATDNDGNSITLPYDYELNSREMGAKAALALCDKMEWPTDLIGNGDVFLFANEEQWSKKASPSELFEGVNDALDNLSIFPTESKK